MRYTAGKNTLLIHLEDRITSENAEEIKAELVKAVEDNPDLTVVFDAQNLKYISSAGLRALLKVRRMKNKNIEVRNVSDEVLEVFTVTNFSDLFDISRPLRAIYLRHSPLTFRGMNGDIYRLENDTMVKVFNRGVPLSEVKKERENTHKALVCNVPTLIPYDVVTVGGSYGIVYESAGCTTLAATLTHDPNKLETYAKRFAVFMRNVHKITIKDEFPDVKERYAQWLEKAGPMLTDEERNSLDKIVNAIPDRNTYIHGFITPGNVIVNGNEFLLMDMAGSASGHPIVDIQGLYSSLVEIERERPMFCSSTFGVSGEICGKFWDVFFPAYMAGRTESELSRVKGFLCDYYTLKKKLMAVMEDMEKR